MLAIPNAAEGHQHTASIMQDDILKSPIPIADGPTWGPIDAPGIGLDVNEDKVLQYYELFQEEGEYLTYGNRFPLD